MMLAIYFIAAWSLVGCIAALLMGRAIAICAGERQGELAEAGGTAAQAKSNAEKTLPAIKAA